MTQEDLRKEFKRLYHCETINDSYDLIDIYTNFLFKETVVHATIDIETLYKHDAKIILQMMVTKLLHIKDVIKGITYTTKDGGHSLNKVIDPTVVGCLIRNVYETVAMFNLIYVNAKSNDEKLIHYNLWSISGLKYRQRFAEIVENLDDVLEGTEMETELQRLAKIQTKENIAKIKAEQDKITLFKSQIEESSLYKSLEPKDQGMVQEIIKRKDYKIKFEVDGTVKILSWQELISVMNIREDIMGKIYAFFSLYSHPSNVSVFQFADLFEVDKNYFLQMTNFNLRNLFFLCSVFIADYIKVFPNALETFNSIQLVDQIIIDSNNTFCRENEPSINDSVKALG